MNVRIPEQLHRQVKTYAFENGLKVQDIVTQALTNHLTDIADS
ncbi:type II toxin-antitoxin system HicB family antitoxin [Corynebacterium choanae]|nr:type II toxin-antitoxin system HicB family antitoxin [Corynebacterium choanae]